MLFALTPFLASLLVHWLGDRLPESAWSMAPELVFFSVMVSVTAFTDVVEMAEAIGWDGFLTFAGAGLLLGAVWSAIMYGIYLYAHVLSSPSATFQYRFVLCVDTVAVVMLALSVSVEVFISRIKAFQ